jgi:4-carboxymuconolactone decarboxylase
VSERYRAGLATLLGISVDKDEFVSNRLAAEAPEFVRLMVEVVFGDIFARDRLDLRTRLFVAIAALAVRSDLSNQLRWFVRAALDAGTERAEVIEALMQIAVFSGFTSAAKALEACADLLADQSRVGCVCPIPAAAR